MNLAKYPSKWYSIASIYPHRTKVIIFTKQSRAFTSTCVQGMSPSVSLPNMINSSFSCHPFCFSSSTKCEMSPLSMLKPMAGKTKHANEPTNYSLQRALRSSIEEPN
jgi:hypothetical protein